MPNSPQDSKRTAMVQVLLPAHTIKQLELLQVALDQGFGQLISLALEETMPRFRSMVLVARNTGCLPPDFDLKTLGLGAGGLRRRDWIREIKRLRKLKLSVPDWLLAKAGLDR